MENTDINEALRDAEEHELVGARINIPGQNIPFFIEAYAQWCAKWDEDPQAKFTERTPNDEALNSAIIQRTQELKAQRSEPKLSLDPPRLEKHDQS